MPFADSTTASIFHFYCYKWNCKYAFRSSFLLPLFGRYRCFKRNLIWVKHLRVQRSMFIFGSVCFPVPTTRWFNFLCYPTPNRHATIFNMSILLKSFFVAPLPHLPKLWCSVIYWRSPIVTDWSIPLPIINTLYFSMSFASSDYRRRISKGFDGKSGFPITVQRLLLFYACQ